MLRIPLPRDFLFPSPISPPLAEMKIRWDGFDPGKGGMRTLSSPRFGMTRNGGARPHGGIDLAAKGGTPIFAVADGVIEDVRATDPTYGVDILLKFRPADAWAKFLASAGSKDDDGVLFAQYAHLTDTLVKRGQRVARGTLIGRTGCSGNADQDYPHLHFEVRKVRWPGVGANGLLNRVNPELIFKVDFIEPIEAVAQRGRTA